MPFELGALYSRNGIHTVLGGSKQSYLPTVNGQVVCGCFDPSLNLRAPREIDIGAGPIVQECAERLVSSGSTIPVFLKQQTNEWRYIGDFRALRLSREAADLQGVVGRRVDAIAVLFLEEALTSDADSDSNIVYTEFQGAPEGAQVLRSHLTRERKRSLVEAKKRVVKTQSGHLICEVCSISSQRLPAEVADGCFEVHHLVPLSELRSELVTRLDDVALLCANCHRMIHRTSPLMTISQFKRLLREQKHP